MKKNKSTLEIKNLSISCKTDENLILKNISFSIKCSEIVAIIGQSGTGKSLLAQNILGILPKDAKSYGDIIYKEQILTKKKKELLRGDEISLIPQSISYLDPMCKIGVQACGKHGKKMLPKVSKIFAKLGLNKEVENLYPHELSGGMAKRVLVAIALISNSDLIIADEPTNGLDLDAALNVLSIFNELKNNSKSLLLITHNLEIALKIADKIVILHEGEVVEIVKKRNFINYEKTLKHQYSKNLFSAAPSNGFILPKNLYA